MSVRLSSLDVRDTVLRRGSAVPGVRVRPDLSREERDHEEQFFRQLGEKKEKNPGKIYRVKGPPGRRYFVEVMTN